MTDSMTKMAEALQTIAARRGEALSEGPIGAETPAVRFSIELGRGSSYVLRNVSAKTATGVTASVEGFRGAARGLPDDLDLPPFGGTTFLLIGSWQAPLPTEVLVTCDQCEAQRVPLPPRR